MPTSPHAEECTHTQEKISSIVYMHSFEKKKIRKEEKNTRLRARKASKTCAQVEYEQRRLWGRSSPSQSQSQSEACLQSLQPIMTLSLALVSHSYLWNPFCTLLSLTLPILQTSATIRTNWYPAWGYQEQIALGYEEGGGGGGGVHGWEGSALGYTTPRKRPRPDLLLKLILCVNHLLYVCQTADSGLKTAETTAASHVLLHRHPTTRSPLQPPLGTSLQCYLNRLFGSLPTLT